MQLKDQKIIVTGAGSGIGQATAVKFAQEGARVAVCDINEAAAATVAGEIAKAGGNALAYHVDVTDRESVGRMVEAVMPEGMITNASNAPRYVFPYSVPGTGAGGNEAQIRWGEAVRGKALVTMRMDVPA